MLVFVYGSLKRGYHNHGLLKGSTFIGEAWTSPNYTMVSLKQFPGVFQWGNDHIYGEVYKINRRTRKRLDRLESEGILYFLKEVHLELGYSPMVDETVYSYFFNEQYFNPKKHYIIEGGIW